MANAAANMWVEAGVAGFFTGGCDPYPRLETSHERAGDFSVQAHELAGVGTIYPRHRTGAAEGSLPCKSQQAALFMVAAAKVIPVEIFAFSSSRCFHIFFHQKTPAGGTCGRGWLYAGDVFAGSGVHPDRVPLLDEVGDLYFNPRLDLDLLGDTGGGISAHSHLGIDDFQIHRSRQFDIQSLAFIEGEFALHAFLQEAGRITDDILGNSRLIKGLLIHEIIIIAIVI